VRNRATARAARDVYRMRVTALTGAGEQRASLGRTGMVRTAHSPVDCICVAGLRVRERLLGSARESAAWRRRSKCAPGEHWSILRLLAPSVGLALWTNTRLSKSVSDRLAPSPWGRTTPKNRRGPPLGRASSVVGVPNGTRTLCWFIQYKGWRPPGDSNSIRVARVCLGPPERAG
jgi:hypothetical protein